MEETNQVDDQTVTVDDGAEKAKNTVDYRTYSKVMDKLKTREREAQEYSERLKLFEQKEMEQKGESSKLIEALRTELNDAKSKLKEVHGSYAWSTLSGQIKEQALRQNCVDPDALIKLMDKEELSTIEVDEKTYRVNQDDTQRLLEKMKQKHNYLFKGNMKSPDDMVPASMKKQETKITDLDSKAIEDLLKKTYGKK